MSFLNGPCIRLGFRLGFRLGINVVVDELPERPLLSVMSCQYTLNPKPALLCVICHQNTRNVCIHMVYIYI
jgi:hypothetical protein